MNRLYRVSFFKKLVDSTGHPVDACQDTFDVPAPDQNHAIEIARLSFAARRNIGSWSLHADYEKVRLLRPGNRMSTKVTTRTRAPAVAPTTTSSLRQLERSV